ncbi:uncharacterized protein [Malus domestica]|uniref:uncharacterized protein n=1 Tax=Malus domestica TaxID=3750 RepID=UPI0039752318
MFSSMRVYKQFEEQQKKLLAQQEELVNLEEGGGGDEAFAMEEDEDDDHRRQRALHSRRVMEVVGLLLEQKVTAALLMLVYGVYVDQVNEITRMGKSTFLESLRRLCSAIEAFYTSEYLRKLTHRNLRRLQRKGAQNDLNVLAQSPVFDEVLQGKAPKVTYSINGHTYDGSAATMFDVEVLRSIMMTCIILHNMIMEDEYDYDAVNEYEPNTMNNSGTRIYCAHDGTEDPVQQEPLELDGCYNQLIAERYTSLQEPYWHCTYQSDLIEHQWGLQQGQDN